MGIVLSIIRCEGIDDIVHSPLFIPEKCDAGEDAALEPFVAVAMNDDIGKT